MWAAGAIAGCVLAYWWASWDKGRHVALSIVAMIMAVLGLAYLGMLVPVKFRSCPKIFVEGAPDDGMRVKISSCVLKTSHVIH